ncbi:hypothetical protein ACFV1L_28850 [Kitasatospora sp. NPDC059646]|uniref:hypothetical protein n=1 Tax=Kitasatospora sp. NPDC059646 TaxID=3346893 RepID=UPI0036CCBAF8
MSVRSRRARLAVLAATAVLGATVPVLGGAGSAWACGDESPTPVASASAPAASASASAPAASPSASAPAAAPAADPKARIDGVWRDADTVTAGGTPVQIGVTISNTGTEDLRGVQPFIAFFNDSGEKGSILHPEDLALEVRTGGDWKAVPMKWGCDPTLRGDYSSLATDLAPGAAVEFQFRVSVTTHSNRAQQQMEVYTSARSAQGAHLASGPRIVLPIVHPGAPTTPAPTATTKAPSTPAATLSTPADPTPTAGGKEAAGPAAVPAALNAGATPTPTSSPVGTGNLASTGGGSGSTPMLIGGTVLVLLGAGGVALAARRRAAHRG